ncbi:hypothetical protein KHA80_21345 [Anaerobacillus sp. HL2]|nr:hypothetical protein KHA80_21345 [Anaerobacillus sp. HL2]
MKGTPSNPPEKDRAQTESLQNNVKKLLKQNEQLLEEINRIKRSDKITTLKKRKERKKKWI